MVLTTCVVLALAQVREKHPAETPVLPQFFRPPTHRPTIAEIEVRLSVHSTSPGSTGVIWLPIPGDYSGQALIGLQVASQPASAIRAWRLEQRQDGLNSLLRVQLGPLNGHAAVSYKARIAIPGFEVLRTAKKGFASWSGASRLVQSTDPSVQKLAEKLRAGAQSQEETVGRVVKWVAKNKMDQQGRLEEPDSESCLRLGGDSLARANLCAGLLRALKIPARTIAYVPTWAEGIDAAQWLTEYATEDGTWDMVDPTVGILYPARNSAIVLSISSEADENGFDSLGKGTRPMAPSLSVPESSGELAWEPNTAGESAASVHVLATFPGPSGSRLMSAAKRRSLTVVEKAKRGESLWFAEVQFKPALSGGPINFALYLDGRPTLPPRH